MLSKVAWERKLADDLYIGHWAFRGWNFHPGGPDPQPPAPADIHGAASAIGESDLSVAAVIPSPIRADTLDSFNLISCFYEVKAEDLVSV
jgi:hypothetical protein